MNRHDNVHDNDDDDDDPRTNDERPRPPSTTAPSLPSVFASRSARRMSPPHSSTSASTMAATTMTTLNLATARRRATGFTHPSSDFIAYSSIAPSLGGPSTYPDRSGDGGGGGETSQTHGAWPGREHAAHHVRPALPSRLHSSPAHPGYAGHPAHPFSDPNDGLERHRRYSLARMTSAGRPSLEGMSRVRNRRRYRLIVLQHPERARMCGFGDKDRRPLSPSLIVKLVVTDEDTGQDVSPWDVNTSLFFLAADLCHPDDLILAPRNLLVHQHAASVPVSMLATTSQHGQAHGQAHQTGSTSSSPVDTYAERPPPPPMTMRNPAPPPPPSAMATTSSLHEHSAFGSQHSQHSHPHMHSHHPHSSAVNAPRSSTSADAMTGNSAASGGGPLTTVTLEHYTRNLVGAAVTSANVLRDENDEYCIFFVLQDLSVRTEGVYRIRLVFTDLAQQQPPQPTPSESPSALATAANTNEGVSEALAECYTEPFTVYSPRRFPGMLEPTELSKKLAAQGIKIAVRSDKKKRRRQSDEAGNATTSMVGGAGGGGGELDELDDDDD